MNLFSGNVPAWLGISQMVGLGIGLAGLSYFGIRELARRHGKSSAKRLTKTGSARRNPFTRLKRRLTWLYGTPNRTPYLERGIRELERMANTSAVCPCGCGQLIVKDRQHG